MNNNQIVEVLRLALKEGRLTGGIGFDDDIEVSLIEAIKKIRISSEKYKWHDLRKNPNDVPKIGEKVLTAGLKKGFEVQIFRGHHIFTNGKGEVDWSWKWKKNTVKTPMAWKYIEPFEEVQDEYKEY